MTARWANAPRVPVRYLALFLSVYAVQGVVFAYFINFNPTYMMAGGVAEDSVGLVQTIALLPFIFKFLAAPVSDRYPLLGLGHRKPYILAGLAAQAVGLVLLSSFGRIHDHSLPAFTISAVLTVAGLALYDTCTDGMIVDVTPPSDRSRVQGLLMFSRFFSATLFSLVFGLWLERTGTGPGRGQGVLWCCAAITALPIALAAIASEPPREKSSRFDWRALRTVFRPRSLVLLTFGTFYAVVAYGVEIDLPVFYDRLEYGASAAGAFGASRNLGRAAGALVMPIGMARLGRGGAAALAVLGLAATEAAQSLAEPDSAPLVGGLGFLFGAANGWTESLFYVMAMEASDPRLAASTYALFMAVSNLSVTGGFLFGRLVTALGGRHRPAFVAAAAITLVALGMIGPLSRPLDVATEEP